MQARPYQQTAVDSIQLNQVNLMCLPQRSGKSAIMALAINQHQFRKVLIIVGYRKIVEQLASYFPNHTHILSGLPFDHTARVHLASFQTLSNRDIDLTEYDCIIQDEYHSRTSESASDVVFQPNCTVLLFTGTPLTNRNKLLTKRIDNFIQPITVRDLLDEGYLAPTRFLSNSNIIGDHASELQTTKQDFDESMVRQIIQKEHLLESIVNLIDTNHLDTQHKTLIYVNYIATANELYELLKHHTNVFIVHSQLTNKQQTDAIDSYQSALSGVLINVRALSLGFDSQTTDTLIYAFFTKIHSLCLQILWRASTINPADPNKVATVYDMTGQLAFVNPYTDFKHYSSKLSCKEQCVKQYPNDPLAQYFCLESCKSDPILVPCIGQLSPSLVEHPFISNYTIHSGEPCMQSRPVWEYQYKQTNPSPGVLRKWSKCLGCGCVTYYDVQTLTNPLELVRVYDDSKPFNTVTILYSTTYNKALAVFDDISQKSYEILMFNSSQELYERALNFFGNKPFQILSNAAMSKLPNVAISTELNAALPLVNWNSDNQGFIRELIRAKLTELCKFFQMKIGYVYYQMRNINDFNQKAVLTFLNSEHIEYSKLLKYFKKLQPKD